MKTSQFLMATMKEDPADAEIASHRLMLRGGLIRPLAAGLYSWMPLGQKVYRRVENIVREEMDRAGALEMRMPSIQPATLWQESGRWDAFGPQLLRLHDRHQRAFCVGPTHEEVITDIVRTEIRSYKLLPLNLYQIQTKFRDEARPRFGVMRAREFVMKDAYSFDLDATGLEASYARMRDAYIRIFDRIGMDYRIVSADSGAIGGKVSEEFHVLADYGEDAIASSTLSDYSANVELVPCVFDGQVLPPPPTERLATVATPGVETMAELAEFLDVPLSRCIKTLIVEGDHDSLVALVLRGDHALNTIKAEAIEGIKTPLEFASAERIEAIMQAPPGVLGPVAISLRVITDQAAAVMADFVCGANIPGHHYTGVNWNRDVPQPQRMDLRNAVTGDPSPDGHGTLVVRRGIEIGHIFQLGTKYSESMNCIVLNAEGRAVPIHMGCYGIGVTRIVAAVIEQNHDQRGIIWPLAIAPWQLMLLPLNMHKSPRLRQVAEQLYTDLQAAGVTVLFDDRTLRPGIMHADSELIGIPYRLVIGDRNLGNGVVELHSRRDNALLEIPLDQAVSRITAILRDAQTAR